MAPLPPGRGDASRGRRPARAATALLAVALVTSACSLLGQASPLSPIDGVGGWAPVPSTPDAGAARRRALDELLERVTEPHRVRSGEVVLRLSLTGGWDLLVPTDLHLTIQDDGRVIRVTDTSVFSSIGDYTSLRLTDEGIRRVLGLVRDVLEARPEDLDGGAGVSPVDASARLEVGGSIALSMDRMGQTAGYSEGQRAWRLRFMEVVDRIRDLDWLGEDIAEPEAPWVPDSMTVLASGLSPRSGLAPDEAFARWPLERSIEELAEGTTIDPYGEEQLVVCLTGDLVGPVFALLTGVNRAYLQVDDGARWELDVRPQYPGYRLIGDPCPTDRWPSATSPS